MIRIGPEMLGAHDALLRAIVAAIEPSHVVEVARGEVSRAEILLESRGDAARTLEAVGGPGEARVRALRQSLGDDRLVVRAGLTLNVLARLVRTPDLVVLAGDPNWYTVLHGLRLVARAAGEQPFPVTLVRDTGWPYGRRDAYPVPDAIPGVYQQPYARRGVVPGRAELDERGLHADVCHSIYEGTEKNGVRTAVEDFVAQAGLPLEHLLLPGFGGSSLIVDRRQLERSASLTRLIDDLRTSALVLRLVEELEQARVEARVEVTVLEAELAGRDAEVGATAGLASALDDARRELAAARDAAARERLRATEMEAMHATLESALGTAEAALVDARRRIAELEAEKARRPIAAAASAEQERAVAALEAKVVALRADAGSAPSRTTRADTIAVGMPKTSNGKHSKRGKEGKRAPDPTFLRALSGVAPSVIPALSPAELELASRRLAKLRRDPKLFFAHSRFEIARKLSRFL